MLETLVGNHSLRDSLCAALAAGKLSHGVLLCGEAGTGAGYAARCLAADYLYPQGGEGARLVMENHCTEVLLLEGEGASGDIKIDRVRAVRRALFSTALCAQGRVVLVRGAHRLNGPSANALLKVLEEPPEGVLFLLTAPGEAAVLPTIRSRCASYSLAPVSMEECNAYLQKKFPKEDTAALAALFGGKIGSALLCLTDKGAKQRLGLAKELALAIEAQDTYAALVLLAGFEKERPEARALLAQTAQLCSASLRGVLPSLNPYRAAAALPLLTGADAQLAANGSAKLVFTTLAAGLTRLA